MRRIPRDGALANVEPSAALAPPSAALPAQGEGVGRPAWVPEDVDFFLLPEAVRHALAEVVEPAYRRLVVEVDDAIERCVGVTMVHLLWLEVLEQHEAKQQYLQTAVLDLPSNRQQTIEQHLRALQTKVRVGYCLARLRDMRRRLETAEPYPPIEVPRRALGDSENAASPKPGQLASHDAEQKQPGGPGWGGMCAKSQN